MPHDAATVEAASNQLIGTWWRHREAQGEVGGGGGGGGGGFIRIVSNRVGLNVNPL